MSDDNRRNPAEDSNVFMYLVKYRGAYYAADCVEVTPDTAYFQVDGDLVRKGIFPKNRLDLRFMGEMGVVLYPVYYPSQLEH